MKDAGIVLAILLLCAGAWFAIDLVVSPFTPEYTTNTIDMVQPGGLASRDQVYADINQQNAQANQINSQANLNNAGATAVILDAQAGATLTVAESCEIRNDCYLYSQQIEKQGQMPWYAWAVIILVVGVLIFAVTFR